MSKQEINELPEDIEVVGPGQMLADARENLNMTMEEVAKQLNFRLSLVKDIEADHFDKSLPETFNRGYLSNYAKLVQVPTEQVLSAYDMLGVAEKQGAEMQSFSKITEKEAHSKWLKWISYLIAIVLIALSIFYYVQEARTQAELDSQIQPEVIINQAASNQTAANQETITQQANTETSNATVDTEPQIDQLSEQLEQVVESVGDEASATIEELSQNNESIEVSSVVSNLAADENSQQQVVITQANAIFTFAGDCWVNIQDATDERIAYGIKKAGYVMELSGVPPFRVTIGKPELVSISFNGENVDMSQFGVDNIAKFTLPINSNS